MFKRLGTTKFVQEALGFLLAHYLRFVQRTNRFAREPADLDAAIAGETPVIVAMWHGQHLMISFAGRNRFRAWPRSFRAAATPARRRRRCVGSASRRCAARAGAPIAAPTRAARRRYANCCACSSSGASVAMTADAAKRARVAGLGIVTLARLSGRPIAPTAVVVSRRFDFNSWDRASLGKPFGRGAIVVGDLIHVAAGRRRGGAGGRAAGGRAGLDAVHARAYAMVGATRSRRAT